MPNGNTGVYAQAIESEWDWIENMLIALSDDEPDEYQHLAWSEPIRITWEQEEDRWQRRRWAKPEHRRVRDFGKRKEVK